MNYQEPVFYHLLDTSRYIIQETKGKPAYTYITFAVVGLGRTSVDATLLRLSVQGRCGWRGWGDGPTDTTGEGLVKLLAVNAIPELWALTSVVTYWYRNKTIVSIIYRKY